MESDQGARQLILEVSYRDTLSPDRKYEKGCLTMRCAFATRGGEDWNPGQIEPAKVASMRILSRLSGVGAFTRRAIPFWLAGASLLLMGGWLFLSRGQVGAQPGATVPAVINGPRLFNVCLQAADTSATALQELKVIQEAVQKTQGQDPLKIAALFETYLNDGSRRGDILKPPGGW